MDLPVAYLPARLHSHSEKQFMNKYGLRFGFIRPLPVILQAEAAECGLTCLTMIARYYSSNIDLPELRRREATSLKGSNLIRLMEAATRLKFSSRALRLELDELVQLRTPCILHWNLDHFVVLNRVKDGRVFIHDPARGAIALTLEEVSKHFTGVALEVWPGHGFQRERVKRSVSLRKVIGPVHGLTRAFIQVCLLALGLEALMLVTPLYMQWVIDQALVSADRDLLTMLGVGFLMLVVFQSIAGALRTWSIIWISANMTVQWIANLFGHLLKLPLDYFEKRHVGDVVSRFGSVHSVQRTLTSKFVGTVLDGLMASATLVLMFIYSAKLTFVVLAAFIIYLLLRWIIFPPLRRATEEQIYHSAIQQTDLLESIRGIQPLKLANQQEIRLSRYVNAQVETTNRDISIQRFDLMYQTGNTLIFGLQRVILIWIAASMVLDGKFSTGMLVSFIAYADQFTSRGAKLIDQLNEFRMLGLHAERIGDIALTEPESNLYPKGRAIPADTGLEVRNVSFRYDRNGPWVLKDCSFKIEDRECVAIAGPSGCGKSTLAKLLLGLLEPEEGTILFGGIDIRDLGLTEFRNKVSAVLQNDHLFAGTIGENISFSDTNSSAEAIEEAAKLAQIHDEVCAMPMGYFSLVGDMGSSLSGGQKQRVLLARALYRKPSLLVLDEATSHLDVHCERLVNNTVRRFALTRVVIAHRPETLASADRTIYLDGGSVRDDPVLSVNSA